jgi:MFS family permease
MVFAFIIGLTSSLPDILFNFYLLSLGFDNSVAGELASIVRLAGFALAIPLGIAVDRFGGIRTVQVAAVINIAVWFAILNVTDLALLRGFYFFSGVFFTAQSVAVLPSIIRVTTPEQRPFLFGLNFSIFMGTGIFTALIGGMLPGIIAQFKGIDAMSTEAYRMALHGVIILTGIGLVSLLGMHRRIMSATTNHAEVATHSEGVPVPLATMIWRVMGRLSLGFAAGVFHPFVNIFLRQTYTLPDNQIGMIIASFSLTSALGGVFCGVVIARLGVRNAILTTTLTCALLILGILLPSPWLFVVVYALLSFVISMVYPLGDVLLMDSVAPVQRGLASSMAMMMWSLGFALAAMVSGRLQVTSGFTLPIWLYASGFVLTGMLYWTIRFPRYETAQPTV